MLKKGLILCCVFLLTACTVTPKPLTIDERYQEAQKNLAELFTHQEPAAKKINFYQALARGIKYNLDYRIKLVNTALQAGQLELAKFTMFPTFNASYSIYNRNNIYATQNVTDTGTSTDSLSTTPNTIRSARMGLSWSVLDFGLGYVKARQQGDRIHIAEEETRKQMQKLSQDVLIAYWDAYSAQQLMASTKDFQLLLEHSKNKLNHALNDSAVPKENILNYEAALLEGNRRIIQLQYKYDKAMLDLKHLLNLPPSTSLILEAPPLAFAQAYDLSQLNFEKVDAITLVSRPELRGQNYQERIAQLGLKTAILQALPGITLNGGWNYNSNSFLLNQKWVDKSFDAAWNLLNLASLPTAYKSAKMQAQYEQLKLMALTLAVLTETRYAFSHYESLRKEYEVAHLQALNAQALYELNKNRKLASLASDQQVITAKLRALTSKMDENLLLSDLSTALGELYLSVGSDAIPLDVGEKPLSVATQIIHHHLVAVDIWDFSQYINKTYANLFNRTESLPLPTQSFTTVKNTKKTLNLIKNERV